ncbi:poly(A) polymerase [Streptacidiphilus sp. PAMC 29251]
MRTSDEIYQRVRWDPQFDPARFVLGVNRRGAAPKRVPLPAFVPGGDIPWHRVLFIEADGEVVWDRATGMDRIDATEAGRVREPRRLRAPFFTAVAPQIWDPAVGWRPTSADDPVVAPTATTLRVLTWNTLWDRYDSAAIATARRRPLLLAALEAADADVIALQEVEADLAGLLLRSPWVRARYTLGTDPSGKDIDDTGLLLLSRLPVREAARHSLGPHKAVTALTVLTGAGPLVVGATHLSSDHSERGADLRQAELARLAEVLAGVDGDLILVGDFNDGRDGPEGPAAVLGLRDAWSEVHGPEDRTPTFDPTVNPLAAVSSLSGRVSRLDRILLRTGGPRATAAVLRGNTPTADGLYPSDHYGVQAELTTGGTVAEPPMATLSAAPSNPAEEARARQLARAVAEALPEGVVHLVGSRRTGCALAGADLDLVAALPGRVDLAWLQARLAAALPDATGIRQVTGARVPGLRLRSGELAVDLVVVATGSLAPAEAVARRAELGEAAAIALSAVSDAEAVTAAVVADPAGFAVLARQVKAWAKARGLDSAPFGGLPGLAWSVLAARTVRDAPHLSPQELLPYFFGSWAAWDWREPVSLAPHSVSRSAAAVSVLTPSEPVRSCTEQVTPATLDLLTQELYRSWEQPDAAPPSMTDRHSAWAVLSLDSTDAEEFIRTLGRIRGRVRALLAALADAGSPDAQAWPNPFPAGPTSCSYAIGLGRTPPSEARLGRIAADWSRGLPGVRLVLAETPPPGI